MRQLQGKSGSLSAALAGRLAAPVPRLAVELAGGRLVAARAGAQGAVLQAESRPLPEGLLQPSATRANVSDAAALSRLLGELLEALGGAHGAEATLLVPDATARVFVLDFDTVPGRGEELAALVRFRLRKSLPFDVERAAVGCQWLSQARSAGAPARVLAAVADRARLDEFEGCLEAAGARPVVTIPSGLACLSAHPAFEHGTLLVRSEPGSLTTAYCRQGRVEFFRVTEVESEPLFDDIVPSLVFYRERWQDELAAGGAAAPALVALGLPPGTLHRLQGELPWIEFRELPVRALSGTASGAEVLAVAGALQGRFA